MQPAHVQNKLVVVTVLYQHDVPVGFFSFLAFLATDSRLAVSHATIMLHRADELNGFGFQHEVRLASAGSNFCAIGTTQHRPAELRMELVSAN
jgi:hypothetical protein